MANFEIEKKKAIKYAKKFHQHFYELLPDWFEYDSKDHMLIRQQIGYALFGPPNIDKDTEDSISSESFLLHSNWQKNIFNTVVYDKEMCKVIDIMYQKIIKYGMEKQNNLIRVGIIFNVIFLHEVPKKSKNENNESHNICVLPVFKLRKEACKVWYVDNGGRIYKSWNDYVTNNTLPKCSMILPKCGSYRCDPNYKVAESSSTVWVEILESPACTVKHGILKGIDVAASVLSICGTVGFGVASFLTPVAPAVLTTGFIYGGINGAWIAGRSSQKLVDLAKHKQSISPIDKNAFPAWLGISSTALAFGASGGTLLMTKAVARGTISTAAKIAYNSVIFGNLTINGIGIAYQGYCLIDKYKREKKIDFFDAVLFTSHVLFFSNILVNTKLASELIQTSKGTVLERFKNVLRVNRFKEEFNKIKMQNGGDEGITYKVKTVDNKEDFFNFLNNLCSNGNFSTRYQNDNIVINNKKFIDPVAFTGNLLTTGVRVYNVTQPCSSKTTDERADLMITLKILLKRLLNEHFTKNQFPHEQLPDVSYFNDILQDVKHMNNAVDVLTTIFKIAVIITQRCNEPWLFLFDAIYFLWLYCKGNLKEYGISIRFSRKSKIFEVLGKIVQFLFECIDALSNELFTAFYTFITNTKMNTVEHM